MPCLPPPIVQQALWAAPAGARVEDGMLVLDPLSTEPAAGYMVDFAATPLVQFTWELVDLGDAPLVCGLWFQTPNDGIYYRTDGAIVNAGVETPTTPAQAGDVVQMFVEAANNRVVFTLNGVSL